MMPPAPLPPPPPAAHYHQRHHHPPPPPQTKAHHRASPSPPVAAPPAAAASSGPKTIGQALIEVFGPVCLKYQVLKEADEGGGSGGKKGGKGGGKSGGSSKGGKCKVRVTFELPGHPGHGLSAANSAPHEREARVAAQWDVARQLQAAGLFKIPDGVGRPGAADAGGGGGAAGGGGKAGGKRSRGGGGGGPDFEADKEATAAYARQAAAAERKLKEYEAQLLGEDSL